MKKVLSFVAAGTTTVAALFAMTGTAGAESDIPVVGVSGAGSAGVVAPLNPQQKLVHFECTAVATVIAASTSVDSCRLYANGVFVASAESVSLPGQAAATASPAAVGSLTSWLMVCWDVSAEPVFGPRVTSSGCTFVNTPVLAA
jgi:hypothetical protein